MLGHHSFLLLKRENTPKKSWFQVTFLLCGVLLVRMALHMRVRLCLRAVHGVIGSGDIPVGAAPQGIGTVAPCTHVGLRAQGRNLGGALGSHQ